MKVAELHVPAIDLMSIDDTIGQHIGLFIVNGCRLFTDVIASSLGTQDLIVLVGSGTNISEVCNDASLRRADVILIDAMLGRTHAIQATMAIKREFPRARVVVVGLPQCAETILDFIEAGANGYVSKNDSFVQLVDIITAVVHEEMPCSPWLAASLFARLRELAQKDTCRPSTAEIKLTPREHEVLRLVAANLSNKEIARLMNVSLSTIKNHIHSILKKLHIRRRTAAIRYAYDHGIYNPWVAAASPLRTISNS